MNGLIEDDLIQFMRERRKKQGLDGVGCKAIYGVYMYIIVTALSVMLFLVTHHCFFFYNQGGMALSE
jgi:hypothetical protein